MFRYTFSLTGMLLLGGAVVLATPGLGQAQHGGGHGGGGFHGGGVHGGGTFHGGGVRGGYSHSYSGYRPYYHSYGSRPYYNYGYRYGSYGYPYSYGYGGYPYSYGYYPYYNDYSAYPDYSSYYGSYPDYGYSADPSYGSSGLYSTPAASFAPTVSSTAQPDMTAHVTVNLPADADLWFEGTKRTATGPVREFQSPPLAMGHDYTYTIRARWLENGKEVTQTKEVGVTAGAHVRVDFPLPPATATQASATKQP